MRAFRGPRALPFDHTRQWARRENPLLPPVEGDKVPPQMTAKRFAGARGRGGLTLPPAFFLHFKENEVSGKRAKNEKGFLFLHVNFGLEKRTIKTRTALSVPWSGLRRADKKLSAIACDFSLYIQMRTLQGFFLTAFVKNDERNSLHVLFFKSVLKDQHCRFFPGCKDREKRKKR